MANNRIFYAVQQVDMRSDAGGAWTTVKGVQSVGMSTTFNLDQAFELGQLAIYENIEGIPDVEVTLTKVLDGYPLIWHLATVDATVHTLAGRSNAKCYVAVSIYDDTASSAVGTALSEVEMSGMYVSSLGYNFPLEDNFTEDVTLVGNNKIWAKDGRVVAGAAVWPGSAALDVTGGFAGNNDTPPASGGVQRRENLRFDAGPLSAGTDTNGMDADPDRTVLPPEVYGINASGQNIKSGGSYAAHVSNITVSADLGREELLELGQRGPFHRVVTFPIEVTCEIETTSHSGDFVSATEGGILASSSDNCLTASNLTDRTIRIATCEETRIYLGIKNKLSAVNYTGGDAGGGNVSVSYTYTTFNDLTVMSEHDTNASGAGWWADRANLLSD